MSEEQKPGQQRKSMWLRKEISHNFEMSWGKYGFEIWTPGFQEVVKTKAGKELPQWEEKAL